MSSSEDEVALGGTINMEDDDDSRMTVDDSQSFMNEAANSPFSKPGPSTAMSSTSGLVTEFSSSMFQMDSDQIHVKQEPLSPKDSEEDRDRLYSRLSCLESEMTKLVSQRSSDQTKIANIDNQVLKQKFMEKLVNADVQIREKEIEILNIRAQL